MNIVLLAIVLVASAVASPSPRLSLDGVAPGMSEARVVSALGKPQKTIMREGFIKKVPVYSGLSVELDEEALVAGVVSRSPKHCLDIGIRSGMPAELAYRKLPELRKGTSALATETDAGWKFP